MIKLNNIRVVLAVAIILAALALVLTVAVKMNRKAQVSPRSVKHLPAADVSLQKIHYVETRKGKKVWDLFADQADYDKSTDTTRLSGITLIIAGEPKTGDVKLVADRAEYQNESGDVTLAGNVKAHTTTGMSFSTSAVYYEAAHGKISTAAPIFFSNGMLSVDGVGMELSIDTKSIKIKHKATATIAPGKKEFQ